QDLAIAASPTLAFTAEEVWQSHPGLLATAESVHLATWPVRAVRADPAAAGPAADASGAFLGGIRDAVTAAIEPLRAAKALATTLEAEVVITAPRPGGARLARHRAQR